MAGRNTKTGKQLHSDMGRIGRAVALSKSLLRAGLVGIRNRIRYLAGYHYPWASLLPDGASLIPDGSIRYNDDKKVFEKYNDFWSCWSKIEIPKKVPSYFLYLRGNPGTIVDPNS